MTKKIDGHMVCVKLAEELHSRIHVQARNLLFEYRLAPPPHRGCVPHEVVEKLMKLYGYLIVKEIIEDQKRANAAANPEPTLLDKIEGEK